MAGLLLLSCSSPAPVGYDCGPGTVASGNICVPSIDSGRPVDAGVDVGTDAGDGVDAGVDSSDDGAGDGGPVPLFGACAFDAGPPCASIVSDGVAEFPVCLDQHTHLGAPDDFYAHCTFLCQGSKDVLACTQLGDSCCVPGPSCGFPSYVCRP